MAGSIAFGDSESLITDVLNIPLLVLVSVLDSDIHLAKHTTLFLTG